jgi:hypothetical protein
VQADRTVDVAVAGDQSAYLGIDDVDSSPNSVYVNAGGDTVSLDFSSDNNAIDGDGDGFNVNATTRIEDLLVVENQGTQEVGFYVDISSAGAGEDFVTIEATDSPGANSDGLSDNVAYDGGDDDTTANPVALSSGQKIFLHLEVDTGQSIGTLTGKTVTFVADEANIGEEGETTI